MVGVLYSLLSSLTINFAPYATEFWRESLFRITCSKCMMYYFFPIFFILYNVKTRLLDITLFFHFSTLSNTINILLLSTFRGLLVFIMHGQCFMVLEPFTLYGNKYILQVHYAPSYHPPLLFGDNKMRSENSIPCNNGPERRQDQAFESCLIKRRGRVKGALESLAWPFYVQ